MKKYILLAGLFVIIAFVMFGFVVADDPNPDELAEDAVDVSTSIGVLDLPEGTLIGGEPTEYITMAEGATLETTEGSKYFEAGTKIDCEHEPWEPDPCDPD